MKPSEDNTRDPDLIAVDALIAENIALGYMELIGVGDDGEVRYRLTEAGERHVAELMGKGQ